MNPWKNTGEDDEVSDVCDCIYILNTKINAQVMSEGDELLPCLKSLFAVVISDVFCVIHKRKHDRVW